VVFNYGERGTKFYIILQGAVEVLIPTDISATEPTTLTCFTTLSGGDSFGEFALLTSKPRSATIQTIEPTHFAVLDKADYQKAMGDLHKQKVDAKVALLRQFPILDCLTRISLHKLYMCSSLTQFKKGMILHRENEKINEIYLIVEGEFEKTIGI